MHTVGGDKIVQWAAILSWAILGLLLLSIFTPGPGRRP